jgi:hypothetical protein
LNWCLEPLATASQNQKITGLKLMYKFIMLIGVLSLTSLMACEGKAGVAGTAGTAGTDGTDGIDGEDGDTGSDGAAGAAGADGIDGIDGEDGEDGDTGSDGAAGTNGIDGVDGTDGEDGAAGSGGADGTDGTDGADGVGGVDGADSACAGVPALSLGTAIQEDGVVIVEHASTFNLDVSDSGLTVEFAATGMGTFEFVGTDLEATFYSEGMQTISVIATDGCSTAIQSIVVDVGEGYTYLGEGECRQANGQYAANFAINFSDLAPHADGDNAALAMERCQDLCIQNGDWCMAANTVLNPIWITPSCQLVTDHATWTAAGMTYDNDTPGGAQDIDGSSYLTYCGAGASCTTRDIGSGVTLNGRVGYHCEVL